MHTHHCPKQAYLLSWLVPSIVPLRLSAYWQERCGHCNKWEAFQRTVAQITQGIWVAGQTSGLRSSPMGRGREIDAGNVIVPQTPFPSRSFLEPTTAAVTALLRNWLSLQPDGHHRIISIALRGTTGKRSSWKLTESVSYTKTEYSIWLEAEWGG